MIGARTVHLGLCQQVEYLGQHLGRNAAPVILDPQHELVRVHGRLDPDRACRRAEFGRIG